MQEKTFEMYRLLSSRSGLIKDIIIDEKTYEVRISDRNGHEIKKSGLSAGEKKVFAVSLLWGPAQASRLKLPIVIDTPLSQLDSTHLDNIVNNYFPNKVGHQIRVTFFLSHWVNDATEKSPFPSFSNACTLSMGVALKSMPCSRRNSRVTT